MNYILWFLLFINTVNAQQASEYIVYMVRGNVVTKKPNGKEISLRVKDRISQDQIIFVTEGSEVRLADKMGSPVVLNKPAAYNAASLHALKNKPGYCLTKYLSLLHHEFFDLNHDHNKFGKKNMTSVSGGVKRSGDCENLIFPIPNMKTQFSTIPFKWRNTSSVNKYSLIIYDENENELTSIPVNDSSIKIDLSKHISLNPGKYFWLIKGTDAGCEDQTPVSFIILSETERNNIENSVKSVQNSTLDILSLIDLWESEGLILESKNLLYTLVKKNDDPVLAKIYADFLQKYKIDF